MKEFSANENQGDSQSLTSDELLLRLREAEETLEAIRAGEVDAVVVAGPAYWMGFIQNRMLWLIPGVSVVLVAPYLASKPRVIR